MTNEKVKKEIGEKKEKKIKSKTRRRKKNENLKFFNFLIIFHESNATKFQNLCGCD